MSIISLEGKKKDLHFLALFNCTRSPSNDRFLTKETCADENKDQRVGETVSFASLVVLSFQYLSRKKKQETEGGGRETIHSQRQTKKNSNKY